MTEQEKKMYNKTMLEATNVMMMHILKELED